ncbi:MAG: hypothetical protein N2560_01775 [Ignavibacteria bacterium]|nr:hypothetical protein [Ignavibacteria bacterium]
MNFEEDARNLVNSIKNDYTNGSMTIARNAISGLITLLTNHPLVSPQQIEEVIVKLETSKPSMPSVFNSMKIVKETLWNFNINNFISKISILLANLEKATENTINEAKSFIEKNYHKKEIIIATTSYSSTVIKLLDKLCKSCNINVFILKSIWKSFDYSNSLKEKLISFCRKVEVIDRKQLLLQFDTIDFALTGADCVVFGQGIVNGTPTKELANICKDYSTPFFVVAESIKYTENCKTEDGFDFVEFHLISKVFSDSIFNTKNSLFA